MCGSLDKKEDAAANTDTAGYACIRGNTHKYAAASTLQCSSACAAGRGLHLARLNSMARDTAAPAAPHLSVAPSCTSLAATVARTEARARSPPLQSPGCCRAWRPAYSAAYLALAVLWHARCQVQACCRSASKVRSAMNASSTRSFLPPTKGFPQTVAAGAHGLGPINPTCSCSTLHHSQAGSSWRLVQVQPLLTDCCKAAQKVNMHQAGGGRCQAQRRCRVWASEIPHPSAVCSCPGLQAWPASGHGPQSGQGRGWGQDRQEGWAWRRESPCSWPPEAVRVLLKAAAAGSGAHARSIRQTLRQAAAPSLCPDWSSRHLQSRGSACSESGGTQDSTLCRHPRQRMRQTGESQAPGGLSASRAWQATVA